MGIAEDAAAIMQQQQNTPKRDIAADAAALMQQQSAAAQKPATPGIIDQIKSKGLGQFIGDTANATAEPDPNDKRQVPGFLKKVEMIGSGAAQGMLTFTGSLLSLAEKGLRFGGKPTVVPEAVQYWKDKNEADAKQYQGSEGLQMAGQLPAEMLTTAPLGGVFGAVGKAASLASKYAPTGLKTLAKYGTSATGGAAALAGMESQRFDPQNPGQLINTQAASDALSNPLSYALPAVGTKLSTWADASRKLGEAKEVLPNIMARNIKEPGASTTLANMFFGIPAALTGMGKQAKQTAEIGNDISAFIMKMAGSKQVQNADNLTEYSANIIQSTLKKMSRAEDSMWDKGFKTAPITNPMGVKDDIINAIDLLKSNETPGYKASVNSLENILNKRKLNESYFISKDTKPAAALTESSLPQPSRFYSGSNSPSTNTASYDPYTGAKIKSNQNPMDFSIKSGDPLKASTITNNIDLATGAKIKPQPNASGLDFKLTPGVPNKTAPLLTPKEDPYATTALGITPKKGPILTADDVKQLNTIISSASISARGLEGGVGNDAANQLRAIKDSLLNHIQNSLSSGQMRDFSAARAFSANKFELFNKAPLLQRALNDEASAHKLIGNLISEAGVLPPKRAALGTLSEGGRDMVAATKLKQALESSDHAGRINLDSFLTKTSEYTQTGMVMNKDSYDALKGLNKYLKNIDEASKVGWWRQFAIGTAIAGATGIGAAMGGAAAAIPLVSYAAASFVANHSPMKTLLHAVTKNLPTATYNNVVKSIEKHLTRAGYLLSADGVLKHKDDKYSEQQP